MDARGGRPDHLDVSGKLRGIGLTGDGAHGHAYFRQLVDQRAPDVAGCTRDKNCVHAIKDGATITKVTCRPCNFSRRRFVVST